MQLDHQKIQQILAANQVDVIYFESIGSTNDYIKTLTYEDNSILCVADSQTQGRGQYDRVWYSPKFDNIYLSFRTQIKAPIQKLLGVSLMVGLTVCQILEALFPQITDKLSLRWPNDIYLNGKKLGGVLIEIIHANDQRCDVVIGVGLNVLMQDDKQTIDQSWVSLKHVVEQSMSREQIIIDVIKQLQININLLVDYGFQYFHKIWHSKDFLKQKQISFESGKEIFQGQCLGVDEKGCLIIKANNHQTLVFSSGKVVK